MKSLLVYIVVLTIVVALIFTTILALAAWALGFAVPLWAVPVLFVVLVASCVAAVKMIQGPGL